MSLRKEFILLAQQPDRNFSELCRRFEISRRTGYKWWGRALSEREKPWADQSRRPHTSPGRTAPEMERAIVELRQQHPAWGGRKLQARLTLLIQQGTWPSLRLPVPQPSTITEILRRQGLLDSNESAKHRPYQHFEHPLPNQLWQMDFKGDFLLVGSPAARCYPLTVLDDHSRFVLCLEACPNQQTFTVQAKLTQTFRRYGLPEHMTMDNGSPWGDTFESPYTPLTVWLLQLGIGVHHSRPYHPQTQGKDERFHRTLQIELLQAQPSLASLPVWQAEFDRFRDIYNQERPHQALAMQVPAQHYQVSPRPFPEVLPPLEYGPEDHVRKVQAKGEFHFQGRVFKVSKAFRGYPIGLRATTTDGVWEVHFHQHVLRTIDLREQETNV